VVVAQTETSLSLGFEFGTAWEHNDDADNRTFSSLDAALDAYSFWNGGRWGMFFHGSWLFPAIGDDDHDVAGSILFGPAFRVRFGEKLTLQTGLGLGVYGTKDTFEAEGEDYTASTARWGWGADVGVKWDLTDKVFLKAGVNLFAAAGGMTEVSDDGRDHWVGDKVDRDTWVATVNPYLSFGVNLYSPTPIPRTKRERPVLGTPPVTQAAQE
jgi:hypothetical protein